MKVIHLIFLFVFSSYPNMLLGKQQTDSLKKILSKFDDQYRSQSSKAKIEMTITNPNWQRTLVLEAWSKGTEKSLIRILKPKKEKGVATLKKGHDIWNYFPKINKVVKIPSSMMMGSWMGSDLTNDDLVKEYRLSEDYTFKELSQKKEILIELTPKPETVTIWERIEMYFEPTSLNPIKQVFFDEKQKPIRQINFSDFRKINGKDVPYSMEIISLNKPGHTTKFLYKELKLDASVSDKVFSRQNLQKRR